MAVLLSDLVKPLVKKDVLSDLYVLGGLFGLNVPAMQPGSTIPTILSKVTEWFCDDLWNPIVVPALSAPFLDYATEDWLSLIAWLVYGRPRIQAQSGTLPILVENRSAVSGTVSIAAGSVRLKNIDTGKTYTNTTPATVFQWTGSGSFPQAIPVMTFAADVVGTGSNATPGQIAAYPIPPNTSPSVGLYAITNTSPILGSDMEEDPALVLRCRVAIASRSSSGPLGAYVDAALDPIGAFTSRNLPAPASWGPAAPAILRIRVQQPAGSALWMSGHHYGVGECITNAGSLYSCKVAGTSSASSPPTGVGTSIADGSVTWQYVGTVAVWCASGSGPSAGSATLPDSDVGKANVAIQMFVVPPGVTATVAAAVGQPLNLGTITLDVSAESRISTDEASATADTALSEFNSTLPVGGARNVTFPNQGYVFSSKLFGLLTSGPGVQAATCSLFSADVAVGNNAVVELAWDEPILVNIVSQGAQ